jgi:hypothetical protein
MIVELNSNLKKAIDNYITKSFDDYIMVQINALAASVCLVNNLNTQLSVAREALSNMHERDDKLRAELALARMEAISNE